MTCTHYFPADDDAPPSELDYEDEVEEGEGDEDDEDETGSFLSQPFSDRSIPEEDDEEADENYEENDLGPEDGEFEDLWEGDCTGFAEF